MSYTTGPHKKKSYEKPHLQNITVTKCAEKFCSENATRALVAEGRAKSFYCNKHGEAALSRYLKVNR
jgi:hypothetical protein